MSLISGPVDKTSRSEVKIALFRSLFPGRDDVYPRRFESRRSGRAGYAPGCTNEWVRGICENQDAAGQAFVAGVHSPSRARRRLEAVRELPAYRDLELKINELGRPIASSKVPYARPHDDHGRLLICPSWSTASRPTPHSGS